MSAPVPERRKAQRVNQRVAARLEVSGAVHVATFVNFSEAGVFLESMQICPPGVDVVLQVDSPAVSLAGQVVWWRMEPFAHAEQMRFGCGVKLKQVPADWTRLVAELRDK